MTSHFDEKRDWRPESRDYRPESDPASRNSSMPEEAIRAGRLRRLVEATLEERELERELTSGDLW